MDIIPELVELAQTNTKAYAFKNLELVTGDGSNGYIKQAPYDRIIVSAGAKQLPEKILEQLKDGGRAVVPVGEYTQDIMVISRQRDKFKQTKYPGFVFVPLVGK